VSPDSGFSGGIIIMKIFSIAKYDLIKMLRDKASLIIMLILPIAFTLIFGSMSFESESDSRIAVGISNLDKSQMSKALMEGVSKDKTIKLVEMDEDKLYDKVKKSEIEMGFIIPTGFEQNVKSGKSPEIKTLKLSTSQDYAVIQSIISNTFDSMQVKEGTASYVKDKFKGIPEAGLNELSSNLDNRLKSPAITVKETVVSDTGEKVKYNASANMSITAILMFVMFTVILGAGDILEERKNNTWSRLSITSTSRSTIIFGKMLCNFLKGWIQVAILILFCKFVMGVDWGSAFMPTLIL
jgi:ABC-2 type transport system permease protein